MLMNVKKLKSAIAIATLSAFGAGAYAGGNAMSVEVRTPSSVSESAPWLTGQPHLGGSRLSTTDRQIAVEPTDVHSRFSTGVTSNMGSDELRSESDAGAADTQVAIVEYWLIGAPGEESSAPADELIVLDIEPSAVGASLQPAPSADFYILTPIYEQG
ncbi:MAG TPA: hypothetical protein VFI62_01735 [Burkholderiales bacterium]|nr:hypothetical protein [Burkholderiales bacterium]